MPPRLTQHIRQLRRRPTAFTIVELLIAVAVLVVIILATARIFGTASAVTSMGEANSNLQQTAAAVERVIREDVSRMSPEGFLAIQCVAVRNDINQTTTWPAASNYGGSPIAPLLDPTRPADAIIRCDRLVFFTDGFDQTARFIGSQSLGSQGGNQQALASRIYIGPAVQLPTLRPTAAGQRLDPVALDFGGTYLPLVPWAFDAPPAPQLETMVWGVPAGAQPSTFGTQPEARQWILARQATLLGDDGGFKRFFNTDSSFGANAAPAIWAREYPTQPFTTGQDDSGAYQYFTPSNSLFPSSWLTAGRVDIAASTLDDIRRVVRRGGTGDVLPWISSSGENQWVRIRNMVFGPGIGTGAGDLAGIWGWPRVEKQAPSMSRVDELLASAMLAGNCSSIEIDWAWREGTGRTEGARDMLATAVAGWDATGLATVVGLPGIVFDPAAGQVWFGIPDGLQSPMPGGGTNVIPRSQWRGVTSLMGPQPAVGQTPPQLDDLPWAIGTNVYNIGLNQWEPFDGSLFPQGSGIPGAAVMIGAPVVPANIEGLAGVTRPLGTNMPVWVYTAIFGFNGNQATRESFDGTKLLRDDYTPWPSALRFTLRLHDPRLTVETGRTVQFVVDLPRQTQE